MMHPLVLKMAVDGVPVTVTCRALGFSKQAFYQWKLNPVTQRDWDDAHLTNAAWDAHHDDPASATDSRKTPHDAYSARSKATPVGTDGHWRIREDCIDGSGSVTLRHNSKLHHIGIGRAHKGAHVRLLIHDRNIRVVNKHTGELLRELTLDPTKDYQPQKTQKALPKESQM